MRLDSLLQEIDSGLSLGWSDYQYTKLLYCIEDDTVTMYFKTGLGYIPFVFPWQERRCMIEAFVGMFLAFGLANFDTHQAS